MVLIIKRIIFAAIMAVLLLHTCPVALADGEPTVSAQSAIVMHSGGEVVFEKNADARSLIASTTKIMTAIVAIERADLDEQVEILPEWCAVEGSSMYLKPGEAYSVKELLTGLMLASGNDAALALADHVAGSEAKFVSMMNRKAKELGLNNSSFANPHGLNAEGHYSTAKDMAVLLDYCMQNEAFAEIAGLKVGTVKDQTYINHNKLLDRCPGCIGGKTGFTERAGRCLVSCCERAGTRFICVTLSAPDDWNDHQKLFDWAYARYADREVTEGLSFDIPVVSGDLSSVKAVPEELRLFLPKSAELSLEAEMPFFVFAPIGAGDEAGRISVMLNGKKIAETRLYYAQSVESAFSASKIIQSIMEQMV